MSNTINSHPDLDSPLTEDFTAEIIPTYLCGEFVIQNYTLTREKESEIIYSDLIEDHGIKWRLKVYPNGNGQAKENYISIFLEMKDGYSSIGKYDYKIEMIHPTNPSSNISREYASDFEKGECWGYNRFYRKSGIAEEGFLTRDDTLHLKFYVRASNYYQHCKDQNKYIRSLEKRVTRLKDKCTNNNISVSSEGEKDEEDDVSDKPLNEESKYTKQYESSDEEEIDEIADESSHQGKGKLLNRADSHFKLGLGSDSSFCEFLNTAFLIQAHSELNSLDNMPTEIEEEEKKITPLIESIRIQEDSLQADDHNDLHDDEDSEQDEEEKKDTFEDKLSIPGEIENQIDDFHQVIDRGRLAPQASLGDDEEHDLDTDDINPLNKRFDNFSDGKNEKLNSFLQTMMDTQKQIEDVETFNNTWKKKMSMKYRGYDNEEPHEEPNDELNSDDDYHTNNFDEHGSLVGRDSDTSDGNLSRDEEAKDHFYDVSEPSSHLIDVSPESAIENEIDHDSHNINKIINSLLDPHKKDILNSDPLSENGDLLSQLQLQKYLSMDSITSRDAESRSEKLKLLSDIGKLMYQRSSTMKKDDDDD